MQLSVSINFISSKDTDESRTMYTKSNNIVIMMGNETDETIEELFKSQKRKISKKLTGSEFVFDKLDLLHYHLHKIRLNGSGSYIDSK